MNELNENKIAVILAAGKGTRLLKLTCNTPKPLILVNGVPIIERIILALKKINVSKIYIVVGYMAEKFNYLTEKYENIYLIYNDLYNTMNNISSIYCAREYLVNAPCYICEADQYISDLDVLNFNMDCSIALASKVAGQNISLAFNVDSENKIISIEKNKKNALNMCGITYLTEKDMQILLNEINKKMDIYVLNKNEYVNVYWDDVLNENLDKINIYASEIEYGKITEIDTFKDLCNLDKSYM